MDTKSFFLRFSQESGTSVREQEALTTAGIQPDEKDSLAMVLVGGNSREGSLGQEAKVRVSTGADVAAGGWGALPLSAQSACMTGRASTVPPFARTGRPFA